MEVYVMDEEVVVKQVKNKIVCTLLGIPFVMFTIFVDIMMISLLFDFSMKNSEEILVSFVLTIFYSIASILFKYLWFQTYRDDYMITKQHILFSPDLYGRIYKIPQDKVESIYEYSIHGSRRSRTLLYALITKEGNIYDSLKPVRRSSPNRRITDKYLFVDLGIKKTHKILHEKDNKKRNAIKYDPESFMVRDTSFFRKHYLRFYRYFFIAQGAKLLVMWLMLAMSAN